MPSSGAPKKGHQSDDDDDFFKPSSNSTLAKIFGISKSSPPKKTPDLPRSNPSSTGKLSERYGSSSFRYVPPPQEAVEPEGESPQEAPASDWSLVQASVVTAYKLINNENNAQGKLGLALLRSNADYRILIYRTKTDALATLNISKSTKLFLKTEYLQFHSDDACFWSVLFENISERDRLLAMVGEVCPLEQEKPHPPKPVPASRTVPIVEEPESDADKSKASLISRMARVGQPILPQDTKPVSTTEVSDSSDTDARIETIPRSSAPPHRRTGSGGGKIHPVTIGMQMVPSAANVLSTAIAGQSMLQTAADVNFNLLMTENRMQGTEVRMNLTKLESKLDRVLDKIDLLNLNSGQASKGEEKSAIEKDEDILALEEKILELKKENHALKGKVRTLEADSVAGKENLIVKQELTQSQTLCQTLKERVEELETEVSSSRVKCKENDVKIDQLNREIISRNKTMEETTKEISLLQDQLKMSDKDKNSLNETNDSLAKQIESLQQTVSNLQKELSTKQAEVKPIGTLEGLVKEIMNNCYQKLNERIDDPSVLKVIGQTIKHETKAGLERQQNK